MLPTGLRRPVAILTDIEGTTTPTAFVREVLFPFARARLPYMVRQQARPDVAAALAEIAQLAPGRPALDTLFGWMDVDAKVTPLKTLQGMIWREGYRDGSLQGALYPDVPAALRSWHASAIRLAVYSSGSAEAQRLLFGYSVAGDLRPLFRGFYDTTIGSKRDAASYRAIAGDDAAGWLFLSDVAEELDAAAAAGMQACQLVRAADGTIPCDRYTNAPDFDAVTRLLSAPDDEPSMPAENSPVVHSFMRRNN